MTKQIIEIWQNADGTWSHHRNAQCKWEDKGSCQYDLTLTNEWQKAGGSRND